MAQQRVRRRNLGGMEEHMKIASEIGNGAWRRSWITMTQASMVVPHDVGERGNALRNVVVGTAVCAQSQLQHDGRQPLPCLKEREPVAVDINVVRFVPPSRQLLCTHHAPLSGNA
jgi:hypothetical protein